MKKFLLIFTLLSACTTFWQTPDETTPLIEDETEDETAGRLDPRLCAGYGNPNVIVDNEDYRETESGFYGQFTMEGIPTSIIDEAPFSGETVEYVYLVVEDDDSPAFNHFAEWVDEGNTINFMQDGNLYFKLGLIEESAIKTSASMDADTKEKILSAMNVRDNVSLTMLQDISPGKGASEYTTFPCVID